MNGPEVGNTVEYQIWLRTGGAGGEWNQIGSDGSFKSAVNRAYLAARVGPIFAAWSVVKRETKAVVAVVEERVG